MPRYKEILPTQILKMIKIFKMIIFPFVFKKMAKRGGEALDNKMNSLKTMIDLNCLHFKTVIIQFYTKAGL